MEYILETNDLRKQYKDFKALNGQLPNNTHAHPQPMNLYTQKDALPCGHGILAAVSSCFVPVGGRLHTRYAPVRHSCTLGVATSGLTVRLACIKPAASVHPEPGSNSP